MRNIHVGKDTNLSLHLPFFTKNIKLSEFPFLDTKQGLEASGIQTSVKVHMLNT